MDAYSHFSRKAAYARVKAVQMTPSSLPDKFEYFFADFPEPLQGQ
jgi:hypothetical protein